MFILRQRDEEATADLSQSTKPGGRHVNSSRTAGRTRRDSGDARPGHQVQGQHRVKTTLAPGHELKLPAETHQQRTKTVSRSSLLNKRMREMTYSVEQARKIYAMGLVPALDAGFNPSLALEIIQNAAQAEREAKAEARKPSLHVGMVVSDGRLGTIIAIEGNRVTLQGYLAKRSAHIGDLHDWQHEAA